VPTTPGARAPALGAADQGTRRSRPGSSTTNVDRPRSWLAEAGFPTGNQTEAISGDVQQLQKPMVAIQPGAQGASTCRSRSWTTPRSTARSARSEPIVYYGIPGGRTRRLSDAFVIFPNPFSERQKAHDQFLRPTDWWMQRGGKVDSGRFRSSKRRARSQRSEPKAPVEGGSCILAPEGRWCRSRSYSEVHFPQNPM